MMNHRFFFWFRFPFLAAIAFLLPTGAVLAQRPLGIDVSDYQGSINWTSVKASGIAFAWTKATEGTGGLQGQFVNNEVNARSAGVPIGAYHYARYDGNPGTAGATSEANNFWSVAGPYIKSGGSYLMPMLDVEASNAGYTPAALAQWINTWCIVVSNNAYASGVTIRPVIYVSACHASWFDSSVAQWIPWIADYNGQDPQTSTPWTVCAGGNIWGNWDVWQYTSTGTIPGISGNVDHDVFNGTPAQLAAALVIGGAGDGAAVVSGNVPAGVLPGASFTATVTMNNTGATAWTNTSANPYRLGSQSPQDNSTWGFNRVGLPASPINPGANAVFTINATAPTTPGAYTFAWQMVQDGVHWFGATFTATINVGNSAAPVSSSVPSVVLAGQPFTGTITMKNNGGTTWTNNGANAYKLGSQSPQDNTTWGTNRAVLPSSPIAPGQNAAFTVSAIAPTNVGTYTFAWRMLQEPGSPFGATFSTTIAVILSGPGISPGSYTIDTGNMDSTSRNGSFVNFTACGVPAWYSFGVPGTSNCTVFNRDIRWMPPLPTYGFSGRGFLSASSIIPDQHATATVKFFAVDAGGADLPGPLTGSVNECAYSCTDVNFFSAAVNNVSSFGGFRSNTQDDSIPGAGGCNAACGTFPAGYGQMHIQAARWQYMDDWTCLGGYSSASVSDTSNRNFNEANLYLYPAVDASHGNAISTAMGLNGKTPGRVTTGDCNNANSLDFKANANAFGGGDNMDAYGFAWIFSPAGGSPKFEIGSDDGNRLWVNGVLKNDNNAARGLTRDQDVTAAVTLPAGWSRVLLKVHNVTSGFQGTVSLRNSSNPNLNEPSVNYYDLGGYYSYGLAYEQDAWYPQIVVSSIYGVNNPVNGAALYGSNTTVSATGSANGQGPVPYWRTMQYQWGNGLGGADTDYADVSGTPSSTNWAQISSAVIGHRRFHFFAVSQSGRTSFQNSGILGGSRFQDAGNYARYYDVYVDNVPPQAPAFSSVSSVSTGQINLAWTLPPDQGVGVGPGSTESAGGSGNQEAQNWYRVGDVGVQVYRDGSVASSWGSATSLNDTGLVANTSYMYTIEARDNSTAFRGNWNNSTGPQATNIAWTLSLPPTGASIIPSQTNAAVGSNIAWTAIGGFGAGRIQYYRYAWDQTASHSFTDTETQWSSGNLTTVPNTAGNWYLHVKGYNGADVGNGTFDYAITATAASPSAPQILSIVANTGYVNIVWSSVSGSVYTLQYTPDLGLNAWSNHSPDIQATNDTASATESMVGITQRFYRVMLLP